MSTEVDTESSVNVSTESVSVEKTFCGEEFAVPAIKFEIRSDSDDPVAIRLVDYIPTDFPMDSVGFHPEFENTNWTAYKDHRVQFERVLEPGEELTTVYGIRLADLDEVPSFLDRPDIYEVDLEEIEADLPLGESEEPEDQVEDDELIDIVSEDSNQVVRDVIAGEKEMVPGLETDEDDSAPDPLADDADPLGEDGDAPDPLSADDGSELVDAEDGVEDAPDPLPADPDDDPLADVEEDLETEAEAEPEPSGHDDDAETDLLTDADDESDPLEADFDGEVSIDDVDDAVPESWDAEETAAKVADAESEADEDEFSEDGHDVIGSDVIGEAAEAPESIEVEEPGHDESEEPEADATDADAVESAEPIESAGIETEIDEPSAPDVESVGAALAAEIREREVSEADLRILRRELDFEQPESTNVRIRHLQSRVDDLEAYTEALEAFIDENGTAQQLLDEYENEVEHLEDRVEGFESELGPDEETLSHIDDLEAELADVDVSEELADVDRRFEELEELVGANTTDTTALAGEVETLESDLESELDSVADRLESIDDRLAERLDALDADLSGRLDSFDDDLDDRFDAVEADVAEIREEIEDVQEWRSQLGSVFGGGE